MGLRCPKECRLLPRETYNLVLEGCPGTWRGKEVQNRTSVNIQCGKIEQGRLYLQVVLKNREKKPISLREGSIVGYLQKKPLSWVVSLGESLHHPPIIKRNVLQLGLGVSLVIPTGSTRTVKFPFTLNHTCEFKGIGNLPRGYNLREGCVPIISNCCFNYMTLIPNQYIWEAKFTYVEYYYSQIKK